MPNFLIQGLLCDFSIIFLVVLFAGIANLFDRRERIARYEDLTRRGFIVKP